MQIKDLEKLTPEEKIEIMSEPVPKEESNKIRFIDEDEVQAEPVEDKQEEKVEEKPSEKVEEKEDAFDRLERELAKEEGKEDLKSFNDREKAYFHQMRRDRKQRQKAEAERDAAIFREIQLKNAKKEVVEEKVEEDIFKDRDPSDLITVEEMRALMKKEPKKEVKEEYKPEPIVDMNNPVMQNYLRLCDEKAKAKYEDYEEVLELTNEIISGNSKYQVEIAECFRNGTNPAEKVYELIKSDAEFTNLYPVAQTRVKARKALNTPADKAETKQQVDPDKLRKAQEAQTALEKNKEKTRTSAHAVGADGQDSGEITLEEISKMSDREFANLPKKKRDAYLRMYG